jgi:hypothetical protein
MICRRIPKRQKEKPYYLKFAKNYSSQYGEDGVIEEIFRSLYDTIDEGLEKRVVVDVGAWDGQHWSNSYHLIHELGWSGVLMEADENRVNSMKALYNNRQDVLCLNAMVDCNGENSLKSILVKHGVVKEPNFLTIDIDGADYHLWKNIAGDFSPHLVCIEFNPTIPNDILYIQHPDISIQKGSSLLALTELGKSLDYTLVATTTFNAFFVRNDFLFKLPHVVPSSELDLDSIHVPSMLTEMFQTYDGELVFVGTKKLLWHELAINSQQLQILSKKNQKFPFSPYEISRAERLKECGTLLSSYFTKIETTCDINVVRSEVKALFSIVVSPVFQGLALQLTNSLLWGILSTAWTEDKNEGILYFMQQCITYCESLIPADGANAASLLEKLYCCLTTLLGATIRGENCLAELQIQRSEVILCLMRCYRNDLFYREYWKHAYEAAASQLQSLINSRRPVLSEHWQQQLNSFNGRFNNEVNKINHIHRVTVPL